MDISLYYEKRGAGEPLVLLHGNGEDGSYFLHQMEAFSREFLVYALDTRAPPGGARPLPSPSLRRTCWPFWTNRG